MSRTPQLPPFDRRVMVEIERRLASSGGVSPSVRELAASIGARTSASKIHAVLCGLEARGLIRRLHGRGRAIEILRPVSMFAFFKVCDKTKTLVPFAQSDVGARIIRAAKT